MKKTMLRTLLISSFFACLSLQAVSNSVSNYQKANADTWNESGVSIRNLMASYALAVKDNPDADYATSESGHYSYFIRHGYLGESRMEKYENVTYVSSVNSSYSTNDADNSNIKEGWQIAVSKANKKPSDGVICGMTAHEKMYFSADYVTLGGWPTNASFNWYVQKSESSTYDLIKTVKFASAADSVNCSGLNRIVLEEGDTIYWEFYYQYGGRNIQKTGDSNELPIFNFSQFVELPPDTLDGDKIVEGLTTDTSATSTNGVVTYTVKNSSIRDNDYDSALSGNLGAADTDYHLTSSSLVLKNGQKMTYELTANEAALINLGLEEIDNEVCDGLSLNGYLKKANTGKIKQLYSEKYDEQFDRSVPQGNVLMDANDVLYIEYVCEENKEVETSLLPIFMVYQDVGSVTESDFPKYNARDYSSLVEIDHATLLKESARMKCQPVELQDMKISLLSGKISESGEATVPFSDIHYTDGEYVNSENDPETASMYEGENLAFNGANAAAVEATRISYSIANYVVYKMEAIVDTHVSIAHDEIKVGWINGTSIYTWGYQKIGNRYIQAESINLPNQKLSEEPLAANSLGMEFDLKAGDVGYYVFGTTMAKNTNLTIAPVFTTNASEYNEEARNAVSKKSSVIKAYHDLVSATVKSQGEPLDFGLLTVTFGHGTPEDIQLMDIFTGTGENDQNDSLSTSITEKNPTLFQRWQMRCGKDDDALIKFVAGADMHLTIVWEKEAEITSWATHTALKSYAVDTDEFLMFDTVKQCVNEGHGPKEDTYYNYDVHLKEGQGFIIDYTSMGANYGVIQYDFVVSAIADEFDETKVFDFTEAKFLSIYCEQKIEELRAIVDTLDIDDYSLVNWAYIDEAFSKFVEAAREAPDTETIDALFDEAKAKIESIQTIEEEQNALNEARAAAKKEVRDYIDAHKKQMTKKNQEQAETLYSSFCVTIDKTTSVSKINIEVTRIKAQIDQLCTKKETKKGGCGGSVVASCSLMSIFSLVGLGLVILRKRKAQ